MEVVVGRSYITAPYMKYEGSFRTWSWHGVCEGFGLQRSFIASFENGLGKSKVFISSCTLVHYSILHLSCSNLIVCFIAWSSYVTPTMPEVNGTVEEPMTAFSERRASRMPQPKKKLTR